MPPTTMTHLCESCRHHNELLYCRATDQFLCEVCTVLIAEQFVTEQRMADEAAASAAMYFDHYNTGGFADDC